MHASCMGRYESDLFSGLERQKKGTDAHVCISTSTSTTRSDSNPRHYHQTRYTVESAVAPMTAYPVRYAPFTVMTRSQQQVSLVHGSNQEKNQRTRTYIYPNPTRDGVRRSNHETQTAPQATPWQTSSPSRVIPPRTRSRGHCRTCLGQRGMRGRTRRGLERHVVNIIIRFMCDTCRADGKKGNSRALSDTPVTRCAIEPNHVNWG